VVPGTRPGCRHPAYDRPRAPPAPAWGEIAGGHLGLSDPRAGVCGGDASRGAGVAPTADPDPQVRAPMLRIRLRPKSSSFNLILLLCASGIPELSQDKHPPLWGGENVWGLVCDTGVYLCRGALDPPSGSLPTGMWESVKLRPRGAVLTGHEVRPAWGRAREHGLVGTALIHPSSAPTALARAIKSVSLTQASRGPAPSPHQGSTHGIDHTLGPQTVSQHQDQTKNT